VTLQPRWALTGKVVDAGGRPARAEVWWRDPKEERPWWGRLPTGKDGTFRIEGIGSPEIEVLAMLPGESSGLMLSLLRPGSRGRAEGVLVGRETGSVVLHLPRPLTVKVENWPGGDAWGRLSLACERTGKEVRSTELRGEAVSRRLTGLEKGETYTLRIMVSQRDLVAVRKGIRAEDGEVTVSLRPGATLRMRLVGHRKGHRAHVYASSGGLFETAYASEDGTVELTGLAGGEWKINAVALKSNLFWTVEVEVPDEGTLDVEVRPGR
ncbi:MAG: hypothetical protein ACYTDY_09215, partial [Planctomycetota bacterium]